MTPASKKTGYSTLAEDRSSCGTAVAHEEACRAVGDVEAALTIWWQELLAVDRVSPNDDFFELGGHSLIGVALFARVKKAYGIDLGLATLFEARTVRQLAEVISERGKSEDNEAKTFSALVPIQPKGTRLPLFWLPGGYGSSVLSFKDVSLLLGPNQPVYGFEAKMPEADEEMESIPARAARYIEEMLRMQPQGPYALVGFCGGGFVAFEMAQQLVRKGHSIGFLGIIECYDERHPGSAFGKLRFWVERTVWLSRNVFRRGPKGVGQWGLRHLSSLALRAHRVWAGLMGNPAPELPPDEVDIYEKARRNVDRYDPVSYPGKSVVLIAEDTYNFCGLSRAVDPRLIWCKLSEGGSEIRTIPGDHMEMLEPPIMYRLAEELKRQLGQANT
jgi:thioesterase domain-containing protein/acyl carrier protein